MNAAITAGSGVGQVEVVHDDHARLIEGTELVG